MAEREALKKEIEELQNLINDYKNAQGDVPSSSAQWDHARHGQRRGQGRGHGSRYTQLYSPLPQPYVPHSAGSWRKTYSLSNKSTRASGRHQMSHHFHVSNLNQPSHEISAVSAATAARDNTRLVRSNEIIPEEQTKSVSAVSLLRCKTSQERKTVPPASAKTTLLTSASGQTCHGHSSASGLMDSTLSSNQQSESERTIKPTLKSPSAVTNPSLSSPAKQKPAAQVKPRLPIAALSSRAVVMPTANKDSSLVSSDLNFKSQPSSSPTKLMLKPDSDTAQTRASSHHKRSRFTWVKNQEVVNLKNMPKSEARPIETSLSPASGSPTGTVTVRRASGSNKGISRKLSLSLGSPKTSKYTWVSSSCSSSTAGKACTLTKQLRKPLSPKSLKVPVRTAQGWLEGPKKLRDSASAVVSKKSRAASTSNVSHTSRYSWKATGQNTAANTPGSVSRSHKNTVYQWTATKNGQKGEKRSAWSPSPTHWTPHATPTSAGAFKLRSRTKIIRRFTSNAASLERSPVVLTSKSRYSLRRRSPSQARTPTSARRAQSKVLVSFGRHKLCRLSLTPASLGTSRSGLSFPSVRSPASHRIIKTRYKIDTRRAHAAHHSPALSYRVKRVQSARTLLQNRMRTTSERPWRGRSMRWIGGALYRVSANKLSRTHTICTPNSRPGEWYHNADVSSNSNLAKTSTTRYIASRAVQKSLAIIRQAHQKKHKAKQYCMYYNRFGKCNHGDACPYIHDPDKVAVCTRFLRGTCKQTDGTCPFSHKVAKEKMPVCSFFLKGICNNSSCPYSHVYVSRKADVCKDFLRGYCPQGDKCKKKHTLVCPDFSSTGVCPRGSKCKLHHRQSMKRTGSNVNSGPAKRAHKRDVLKRSEEGNSASAECEQADEGSSCSDLKKLPSFISLSSSPDTEENTNTPQLPPAAGPQAKGKSLHIKPRF